MIIVTRRTAADVMSDKYYKCTCAYCESEYYFTSNDTTTEKQPNGKSYIRCPVCDHPSYLSPEIFRKDDIKEVDEDEYMRIVKKHSHEPKHNYIFKNKDGEIQC